MRTCFERQHEESVRRAFWGCSSLDSKQHPGMCCTELVVPPKLVSGPRNCQDAALHQYVEGSPWTPPTVRCASFCSCTDSIEPI